MNIDINAPPLNRYYLIDLRPAHGPVDLVRTIGAIDADHLDYNDVLVVLAASAPDVLVRWAADCARMAVTTVERLVVGRIDEQMLATVAELRRRLDALDEGSSMPRPTGPSVPHVMSSQYGCDWATWRAIARAKDAVRIAEDLPTVARDTTRERSVREYVLRDDAGAAFRCAMEVARHEFAAGERQYGDWPFSAEYQRTVGVLRAALVTAMMSAVAA